MLKELIYASIVFMGFLAIMNPIADIPIFLSLTAKESLEGIKRVAFHATLTAFIIVVIFSLAGHFLLNFFGVTFTALRLTGGIIVAIIGYEMLQGEPGEKNSEEDMSDAAASAITPLGTPLLAGPGVIITAMNFSSGGIVNCLITIFSFTLLCTITYYVFVFGKQIRALLGANILKVITKMMGLILAVIGTQMFLEGVFSAVVEFHDMNFL